jgi:DNA-binding LacI/PurR family transcriptional regulator
LLYEVSEADAMSQRTQSGQSRREELKGSLLSLCAKLGPGGKLPTIRGLASDFEASTSTLDRLMGELELEGRILRRHGSGIYVAQPKKATTIAFVTGIDPFSVGQSPFYLLLAERMRKQVAASGRDFKFYLDPHFDNHGLPARTDMIADFEAGRLLGAVFAATAHPDDLLWLNERKFPYIGLTDCPYALHRYYFDYADLVAKGVALLAKAGCKRICLLSWYGGGEPCAECVSSFKASLAEAGLPLLPGAIHGGNVENSPPGDQEESRVVAGARGARELFKNGKGFFDGLVCADDMLCAGALDSLHRLGAFPGRDLLVATHANKGSPVLGLHEGDLIKIELDVDAVVAEALSSLAQLIDGRSLEPFFRKYKAEAVQ